MKTFLLLALSVSASLSLKWDQLELNPQFRGQWD